MVTHNTNSQTHGDVNTMGGHFVMDNVFENVNVINIGQIRLPSSYIRFGRRAFEVLQLFICIIDLGTTASNASGMINGLGFQRIPGKLGYNIFVDAFSLLAFLIIIPIDWFNSSLLGRDKDTRESWYRIAFNVLLTCLWIGSIPASFYNCGDLCSAGGIPDAVIHFATLYCECSSQSGFERLVRRGTEQRTGRYEATSALDILETICLLITTTLLIVSRRVKKVPKRALKDGESSTPHN